MSDSKEKKEETKRPRMEPYKRERVDWYNILLDEDNILEAENDERE